MKKIIAAAVALALSGAVFADGGGRGRGLTINSPNQFGQANANAGAAAKAESDSTAAAYVAPQQSITYNQPGVVDYRGGYDMKTAPSIAIGGPASGPCNGFSAGLGVSFMGGAVMGNMSKVDEGCEERETARIAALMGRMDVANTIIENTEVYKRALKRKEEAAAQPRKAEAPQAQKVAMTSATPTTQEQSVNQCSYAKSSGDTFLAARVCPK
jgi:hypothetical protein